MHGFIVFDKSHKFTNLEIAKAFLKQNGLPIMENKPITQVESLILNNTRTSNPFHYDLTVFDTQMHIPMQCELYFTDYELHLEFGVAKNSYDYLWQTFVTYYLKDKAQKFYVKSIEEQMINNLKLIDEEYIVEIDQAETELVKLEKMDMHDYLIKEAIFAFNYLKVIKTDLGLIKQDSYNPFMHPYFVKKEKAPRLVEIVAAANMRERETGQYNAVKLAREREF